jgi:hypothetical protein
MIGGSSGLPRLRPIGGSVSAGVMLTPKELQRNADDCLRLARDSNEINVKLALIEMATEFRVMAQHLEGDTRPRSPSRPRRLRLPADVVLRLRSGKRG